MHCQFIFCSNLFLMNNWLEFSEGFIWSVQVKLIKGDNPKSYIDRVTVLVRTVYFFWLLSIKCNISKILAPAFELQARYYANFIVGLFSCYKNSFTLLCYFGEQPSFPTIFLLTIRQRNTRRCYNLNIWHFVLQLLTRFKYPYINHSDALGLIKFSFRVIVWTWHKNTITSRNDQHYCNEWKASNKTDRYAR